MDEIGRKSENKILLQNSVHTRPGQKKSEKNSKKILKVIKPLPGIFSRQKLDEIGWKSKNKILLQNPVNTRPRKEKYEKNSKKIQKIIKPLPGIIFSQNGMR